MGIATWISIRCEILPVIEEPYFVSSSNLTNLLELSRLLIKGRLVDDCFILNNTNLAKVMGIDEKTVLMSGYFNFNITGEKIFS